MSDQRLRRTRSPRSRVTLGRCGPLPPSFAAPRPRRPALASSVLAPVFFIGGTLVAQALWPEFDPVRQTISELAAGDAPTRVFMTIMLALTGLCHLVTSVYAVSVVRAGRIALGLAGLATIAVAAFPLPSVVGSSTAHTLSAMAGFVLLAIWPALVVAALALRQRRDHRASVS